MLQIILLKSENYILREENETLGRCRRPKKTRFKQGGSLNLGEGQDMKAQNEVDAQVKQEMHQSCGRNPRTETKLRRSGVCGKPGHDARTFEIRDV